MPRPPSPPGAGTTLLATALAMAAFAANSLLCRAALRHTAIDPASFTLLRVAAGALATGTVIRLCGGAVTGDWGSALALAVYASAFSFAYLGLPAGMGALLLFLAVQATMLVGALRRGERLRPLQGGGLLLAVAGLLVLLRPGAATPPLAAAALMLAAGAAWGVYSLRGRNCPDPIAATAGNFLRAVPLCLLLGLASLRAPHWDGPGVGYAVLSGALASGLGYILWYRALGGLGSAAAASVQLSVPVLAALAGVVLLREALTPRLGLSALAILGGIALVLRGGGNDRARR
jgi:drug/metabolite transporter (DMT)-like permease